jgi:hypothetical protein
VEFDLRANPLVLLTAKFDRVEVDGTDVDGAFARITVGFPGLGEQTGYRQAERH